MDESYFRDRISGYFDKSLPPDEYQLVDDYLKKSADGRALLDRIGRLDEFVQIQSELTAGDDFFERQARDIEARLGFESATPAQVEPAPSMKWRGTTWKWIGVAASIAVLSFVGYHQKDIFGPAEIIPPSDADREIRKTIHADQSQPGETFRADRDAGADESGAGAESPEGGTVDKEQPQAARDATPHVSREIIERDLPAVRNEADVPALAEAEPTLAPPVTPKPSEIEKMQLAEEIPAAPKREFEETRRSAPGATRAQSAPIVLEDDSSPQPDLVVSAGLDAIVDTSALARYRAERERIMAEMKADTTPLPGRERETAVTKSLTDRQSTPVVTVPRGDDRPRRLLEACYQITRLTEDDSERATMVRQIKAMADDTKSTVRDQAKRYYDELTRK